jgi:hypothetical protein
MMSVFIPRSMLLLIQNLFKVVLKMDRINSPNELMEHLTNMRKEKSVCQIFIPTKGRFTIVFEDKEENTIADEVKANPHLAKMFDESIKAYQEGRFLNTSELLKSISLEDFRR